MTNQEAKQVLLAYISPNGVGFPDVKEAIKIMIDREEVGAGDCISRQAVIDKLDRLIEVERKQGKELNYCRVRFAAVILSRKREILTAVVMYIG